MPPNRETRYGSGMAGSYGDDAPPPMKKTCGNSCSGCKCGTQLKLSLPDPDGQEELNLKDIWDPL